jgi:hypothetical protein
MDRPTGATPRAAPELDHDHVRRHAVGRERRPPLREGLGHCEHISRVDRLVVAAVAGRAQGVKRGRGRRVSASHDTTTQHAARVGKLADPCVRPGPQRKEAMRARARLVVRLVSPPMACSCLQLKEPGSDAESTRSHHDGTRSML